MLSYFKRLLANTNGLPMIDLSFFSVYEPSFGFRIQFNVLYGAKAQDSIYSTIVSIAPPASLYNPENRSMFQAYTLTAVNWKCTTDFFTYNEDEVGFKNTVLENSSALIFDIKRYNFVTKSTTDFGFAVYPLIFEFQQR